MAPILQEDAYIAADGKRLALTAWAPGGEPMAIVLALHGFNDYRMAFELPGKYLAKNGIMVLAYDQRGFGEEEKAGYWAERKALRSDLLAVLGLVRAKFHETPLFVMGESMGGALALYALAGSEAADGLILVAPAVWGKRAINIVYVPALWLTAHIMPGKKFSGKTLKLVPTDNIEALIAMSQDPYIIKKTRIDAIYGLARLMKQGMKAAPEIKVPTFLIYGEKDDMVSAKMSRRLWAKLPAGLKTQNIYNNGYHLLLRDCAAGEVWWDVLNFIALGAGFQIKPTPLEGSICEEKNE
ncbi:MAG: lysophospholipase [Alphaproteobacteria bacterium]